MGRGWPQVYEAEVAPHPPSIPAQRGSVAEPPPAPSLPGPAPAAPAAGRRRALLGLVCLTTGLALLAGPTAARMLRPPRTFAVPGTATAHQRFALARGLWHTAPGDALLPPRLDVGDGTTWTRTTAPTDTACAPAELGRGLYRALGPVGCTGLLRAAYTDLARSRLVTVGVVTTDAADHATTARFAAAWQRRLRARPRGLTPPPATGPAASAAAWVARPDPARPWLVWTVAAFADGRPVATPTPADAVGRDDPHAPLVEAGLPAAARLLADGVSAALDRALETAGRQHPAEAPAR